MVTGALGRHRIPLTDRLTVTRPVGMGAQRRSEHRGVEKRTVEVGSSTRASPALSTSGSGTGISEFFVSVQTRGSFVGSQKSG